MTDDAVVAVPQLTVDDLDAETNRERLRKRAAALPERADLAVFPEYALTGFVPDDRVHDVALARETALGWLREVARESAVAIVAGFLEAGADGRTYNTVGYVPPVETADPDGGLPDETAVYRKRNLRGAEADLLTAGEERVVVETAAGATALLTCYDLNFVAESAALAEERVDALVVPAAWPAAYSENWRLLLRARALDGVRWVVGAGRTGSREVADAPATEYAGRSAVVRPDGVVHRSLARGERDLVATLDEDLLREQRAFVGSV
ncbi:carbon-nitrogen hydrolase family protein [Haloparvum sedimenti]|uniref:carbon-nitrogen hydrolase family protein n=1 Tax=Haloparvum sedimenti TaxID=1678448 RepID=UPI00071E6D84|nr:carbon-nitrogen hydrolase family protein [Haloparvum sedimenti]